MSLSTYLQETRAELKKVNWPSRQATINFTVVVIGLSLACAALLGTFDFVFTSLVKMFF